MDVKPWLQQASLSGKIPFLKEIARGFEKESLRITKEGCLSVIPHPVQLGAALTHPYITTDYSESLLEFVTAATTVREEPLQQLHEIHQFVYGILQDEILWPCSMPCALTKDEDIPIAYYGKSNKGLFRSVYRLGLGFRYGRAMQMIAGIHYNFSLPEAFWPGDKTEGYLGLIRNYLRFGWILPWLFGASPAVEESFFNQSIGAWHKDHSNSVTPPSSAVSLRLSDIGYRNKLEGRFFISHNSLPEFIDSLKKALSTKVPAYEAIGVEVNNEWRQLNANMLQIEAEYYGIIRPKNKKGPRLITALAQQGIEYIELRALDLDPRLPMGVHALTQNFMDILLVYCALLPSPLLHEPEALQLEKQHAQVVSEGQRSALLIRLEDKELPIQEAAISILNALAPVAAVLDELYKTDDFHRALSVAEQRALQKEDLTAVAIQKEMVHLDMSFSDYGLYHARQHKMYFDEHPLPIERRAFWDKEARNSLACQQKLEQENALSFADYLKKVLYE